MVAPLLVLVVVAMACTQTRPPAADMVTRNSLQSLASGSDVVLIGVVRAESGTRNMARQPDDPRKPHQTLVITGQDYEVSVLSVLKGTAEQTIVVTAAKSVGTSAETMARHPNYVPTRIGGQYLFFLDRQIDGTSGYVPSAEPWRFELTTTAEPISAWTDASRYFPKKPRTEFIAEVMSAIR